jgi:hypothetical protein
VDETFRDSAKTERLKNSFFHRSLPRPRSCYKNRHVTDQQSKLKWPSDFDKNHITPAQRRYRMTALVAACPFYPTAMIAKRVLFLVFLVLALSRLADAERRIYEKGILIDVSPKYIESPALPSGALFPPPQTLIGYLFALDGRPPSPSDDPLWQFAQSGLIVHIHATVTGNTSKRYVPTCAGGFRRTSRELGEESSI